MADEIGKCVLSITADTTGLERDLKRAEQLIHEFAERNTPKLTSVVRESIILTPHYVAEAKRSFQSILARMSMTQHRLEVDQITDVEDVLDALERIVCKGK